MIAHFILLVAAQETSTKFYSAVLRADPILNVPGMTEFRLSESAILGLMPASGIKRLLGDKVGNPASLPGVPRSELYLMVDDPRTFHDRAIAAGAEELSPLALRDWGHRVAYSLDPDKHLLAFASVDDSQGKAPETRNTG